MSHEAQLAELCRLRGVRDPCETCHGLGVKMYSSTATYWGGMGGAAMRRDLCDTCWGSGDKHHQFFDVRKYREEERERVAKTANEYFAQGCGTNLKSFAPALEAIVTELEKLARGRKERPRFFYDACSLLAKKLRAGIEAARKS
jgi:hypothetical protein